MREHAASPQNVTAHEPCKRGGWLASALRSLWLLVALQAASSLAACGGGLVPVLNIHNAPIVVQHGEAVTQERVRDAIIRALAARNWQLNREAPDGIVATLIASGHSATVHIRYDERTYSIEYVDSSPGLRFNGGAIHRRYNDWIERLYRSIRANLLDSRYASPGAGPEAAPVPPVESAPVPPGGGPGVGPSPQPPVAQPPAAAPPPAVAPPPATDAPRAPRPPAEHDELPPPPPPPPPTAPRK